MEHMIYEFLSVPITTMALQLIDMCLFVSSVGDAYWRRGAETEPAGQAEE